jgi:hypothetical protein
MKTVGPLDENDKRRLVFKLIARLRCVECGEAYNAHDFSLVGRWQDVWVLSADCRNCGDSSHVVIAMQLAAEPEAVLDLTPEEAQTAKGWPPVSADDVLDMHLLLREFDGDFESILTS